MDEKTRTLTALFDSEVDAIDAKRKLLDIGVPESAIAIKGGMTEQKEEKGFWDILNDLFFPDDDREVYAEALKRGGYLLTVTGLYDPLLWRAADILDDEGTVDLDHRTEEWRKEGWKGYARHLAEKGTEAVIPIIKERLVVGKRDTSGGQVRVRTYTTEEPVQEGVTLREQNVTIERRPADRPATAAEIAAGDRTVVADEIKEEAVVSKEARVVEEVVVRTDETEHTETVSDTVKKTEVETDKDK